MAMVQNAKKKAGDKSSPTNDETRQIYRVAGYAFVLNLLLLLVKAIIAIFSGSLAIAASAIDSGTDAVASLVVYAGVKLSAQKTRSFPMGLYKLENVASVVIAIFIFIAGYEIIQRIFHADAEIPRISLPHIALLSIGTLATFGFGQYAISTGRKTGSPTR